MRSRKPPGPPPPYESEVLRQCLQYLSLAGVFAWRNNTGAFAVGQGRSRRFVRAGTPGSADILGVLPGGGRVLAIETKRQGRGRTSALQEDFLGRVRARGGLALVVSSVEELRQGLRAAGYEVP